MFPGSATVGDRAYKVTSDIAVGRVEKPRLAQCLPHVDIAPEIFQRHPGRARLASAPGRPAGLDTEKAIQPVLIAGIKGHLRDGVHLQGFVLHDVEAIGKKEDHTFVLVETRHSAAGTIAQDLDVLPVILALSVVDRGERPEYHSLVPEREKVTKIEPGVF